ncbi:MAG TPA: hypothetical protein DIV41_02350 [Ruminococcaceae bacterium]|nr:hypothetical protein [Oscillospiraceae bacterium]
MRKLKIAVCDDEAYELKRIKALVEQAAGSFGVAAEIFLYKDSGGILNTIENGSVRFDMLFLDLYIDDKIGFDIAAAVRKKGYPCAVIFITAFADRMPESFQYVTSAYLLKPVSMEKMLEAFGTALNHLQAVPNFFLHTKEEERAVPFREIVYLESHLKWIYIHVSTSREPITFQGKLADISREFPREYFSLCHKSFLVNFNYVLKIDKSTHEAVLTTNDRLPISRSCYVQILKDFMRFHSVARGELNT